MWLEAAAGWLAAGEPAQAERAVRQVLGAAERGMGSPVVLAGAERILAQALAQRGQRREACDALGRSLQWDPSQMAVANNRAWLLATDRGATAEELAESLRLAQEVCERDGARQSSYLDTLAVAQAAAGDFAAAIATAEAALAAAQREGGDVEILAEMEARLRKYEVKERYFDNGP